MSGKHPLLERLIAPGLFVGAVLLGIVVVVQLVRNPQTDDAIVVADIIDVVPQVSGTISELHVADNDGVRGRSPVGHRPAPL